MLFCRCVSFLMMHLWELWEVKLSWLLYYMAAGMLRVIATGFLYLLRCSSPWLCLVARVLFLTYEKFAQKSVHKHSYALALLRTVQSRFSFHFVFLLYFFSHLLAPSRLSCLDQRESDAGESELESMSSVLGTSWICWDGMKGKYKAIA
jgi:hypothetical protein